MPLGSASDLAFILSDAANVDVTFGLVTVDGIRDDSDALTATDSGGMVQTRAITILIATDALSGLQQGGRITAKHKVTKVVTSYRLDRIAPEDDGDLTRLYVAKVTP